MSQQNRRWRGKPDRKRINPDAGQGEEPDYLIVGRVVRPHGVRGDVAMKIMTDYPERLVDIETLYIGPDYEPYIIERVRSHKIGLLVKFKEINDRDEAEVLRDQFVNVHISNAIPLEEGEYYLYELEGMRVVTDEGEELGTLTDYIETGANDVYIVSTPEGGEILLPAIPDVIKDVDRDGKIMTVTLLEGLV